ncbi:DUF4440 domain-containing protein [Xenorhabdus bovienii]|uniref:DUF4440 domain-containing protein n=2 Tax=Xenorhabdus bovienii TaxID=40576 RepID=A0A077MZH9_XENBV|nr:DUF4440 domain-containing protein [Xenorhabdus bovienii]MCG3471466.1 DUF4440 domain-containing protein [Xenorhabdus bovienii]CDG89955.1 hypothetical protein XBFFR1_500002 [Xenorhabdus bovienii str. feltiae France]CDG91629.1 hypothetical protein XBFFL1_1690003 [Xenorhabdus bovienii str. feltiae Florida]CDG95206.1 hypothetical protein XBP1_1100002 [Xenorhabdus bovienii str. puntauvense]
MHQKNSAIFELLKNLEISLHKEKRKNIDWLNTILHDDFLEIAKSGYVYSKKIVIDELTTEFKMVSPIFSQDFNIKWLDENIALITYQSYEINKSDHPFNKALRSSIWQLSVSGTWQLRFHQGTIMAAQPLGNITP